MWYEPRWALRALGAPQHQLRAPLTRKPLSATGLARTESEESDTLVDEIVAEDSVIGTEAHVCNLVARRPNQMIVNLASPAVD